ncbi:MAG: membrane protein insertion efficiency factor YidD [Candidatus Omnitrophica bacterium]|nr:membrane protein insertion efficiency factor YidD [Candidatus Omnitrophota bacterium]
MISQTWRKIRKIFTYCALKALAFYRNYISILMLPRCRYYPSCSVYAQEAISKKGLWQGLNLSLRRLLRCHPFSRHNFFDPVK